MKQARKPAAARRSAAAAPAGPPGTEVPRAALVALAVIAAGLVMLATSFRIYDPDFWQHLLVGKVIWTQHAIPRTQLWSWPTWGAPDVLPSWFYRVLLWPFWNYGGEAGIALWRWLTTLGTFGFAWATCRRMGARGHWALLALVWCAMVYRYRSQARPETLVVLLIAAQCWVLVRLRTRREGESAIGIAAWLVPIAWAWANVHLSYLIGFALTGFYALGERFPRRRGGAPPATRPLALALLACVLVSFVNPFGWRALAQPFEYLLTWRHEAIFEHVAELQPIYWGYHASSLLPEWLAAVGLLTLWNWWKNGFDFTQFLLLAVFTPEAWSTQRFLGPLSVLVAPYFARDLDRWAGSLAWPPVLRRAAAQVVLVLAGIGALGFIALRDPLHRPGWGFRWSTYPVSACDWMLEHDVRGRGFNFFELGGYLNWRFWPERDRLPFMDIHQAGTPLDRLLAAYASSDSNAWQRLDDERHFDWAVVSTQTHLNDRLLEVLDRDTTRWALVSWDDAAALYLRRGGRMSALAEGERYRLLPGGIGRLDSLSAQAAADSTVRKDLRLELERAIRSSKWNGSANNRLAIIDLFERRGADTRRHLAAARAARDDVPHFDERMGQAWLMDGHPREAEACFRRAQRGSGKPSPTLDLDMARALQAQGRRGEAENAYRRALEHKETHDAARDSLALLGNAK